MSAFVSIVAIFVLAVLAMIGAYKFFKWIAKDL